MSITKKRTIFAPFEYSEAYDFWEKQTRSHWHHFNMHFGQDVMDFRNKLSDSERNVIGNVLKGFTQAEIIIGNDYWAHKVAKWFPKPEIQLMAMVFSGMEAVHTVAYSQIDENLNLDNCISLYARRII